MTAALNGEFIPAAPAPVRSTKLMYGPDDKKLSFNDLCALPTPAPRGPRHRPVSFGNFVDLVKHRLDGAGVNVTAEDYVLSPDGESFFGAMLLNLDGFSVDGMEITLGVRGSHNNKLARGLTLGNRVIVCSNLCFSGDLGTFKTKHTLNVWDRLPGMVENAIARLPDAAAREAKRHDAYRLHRLTPKTGDAALVELVRRGALTTSALGRAVNEWDKPSYDAHAEDGFTAWRLLNAVTESLKPTGNTVNMLTVRDRSKRAIEFMDELVAA